LIGNLIGVFGSNPSQKSSFLSSISKKSETEGIIVYQKTDSGRKYSFLDDATFPEKIQGYARIASIADYAYFVFPSTGKLAPSDGELAVLLDSCGMQGEVQMIDSSKEAISALVKSSFRGMTLERYEISERSSQSSILDVSRIAMRQDYPTGQTLVYIDRAFNVKGVGVVVLGFVLCGRVTVHDKLRLLPAESGKLAEVKGIQISDEDHDSTERGVRVGLSLKGVELKDLSKVSWMDDGTFSTSSSLQFEFSQSPYYKQAIFERDLHTEVLGELLVSRIAKGNKPGSCTANLQYAVPIWEGMTLCVIDLNSKSLRIAGGGRIRL
jgi:selenocysteine-specific translation elongation factor